MKKFFRISLIVMVLASCGGGEELENLKNENARLKAEKESSDSTMKSIIRAYQNIDSTSQVIDEKKQLIREKANKSRLSRQDKAEILAEMDSINSLLDMNRSLVFDLEKSLSEKGSDNAGLGVMLQSMNDKNSFADDDVVDMKKDLAQMSKDFSELFEEYVYKEAENLEMREQLSSAEKELKEAEARLEEAKEELESAWYILGSKDELKEKDIVYKKGFFDNKSISEDIDKQHFKKVNIYEFKEIILDVRKADIVTTHPAEAYELVGIKKRVNRLVIKDPDEFWSVSKVLIVVIEE